MRVACGWLLLLLFGVGAAPTAVAAVSPCNNTTEVVSPLLTVIASRPARLCGVMFFATAANGYCQVVDSPDGTATHAQTRVIAEPGAATSGNSAQAGFGDNGYPTQYGLTAHSVNGRCILLWGSTP